MSRNVVGDERRTPGFRTPSEEMRKWWAAPSDVLEFFVRRGMTGVLEPEVRPILVAILSRPPSSVKKLAKREACSRRALVRRLRRAGLPPPREWVRLAKILAAARRIRVEGCTIARTAREENWSDPFTLSRSFHQATGMWPSEIRTRVDPEEILDAWLERMRHSAAAKRSCSKSPP